MTSVMCFGATIFKEEDCDISRAQCGECARKYCDIDRNGVIDVEEIRAVRAKYLTFYERFFAFILSETPERMLEMCGNGDKSNPVITEESFASRDDTCLYECAKRHIFWDKICMPAAAEEHERIEIERAEKIKNLEQKIASIE